MWSFRIGRSELTSKGLLSRILVFALVYDVVETIYRYASRGAVSSGFAVSSFVAGLLFATVLGYVFLQVPFQLSVRIALAWLALFIVEMFSNLLEGYFFTTIIPTISMFFAASMMALLITFVQAFLAGVLFIPRGPLSSPTTEIRDYFGRRPWYSWALRIALCSVIYFPIYFTFGALISPIVVPYYTDSYGLGLRIPSFEVMVPLELLRGFLYVLAFLPLLVSLKIRQKALYASVVSILYIIGAFGPLLIEETLPIVLRTVHGIEILADSLVFGAVIVYLLGRKL